MADSFSLSGPKAPQVVGSKPKVAPRSSLQFKIGPSFTTTKISKAIFTSEGFHAVPLIEARLDRGFEPSEQGTWIGYKRNYFTLVATFNFANVLFDDFLNEQFYVEDEHRLLVPLKSFLLDIKSYCFEDDKEVPLVQHTAKRDKGPQFAPEPLQVIPGRLPDHQFIREAANIRNKNKIKRLNQKFFFDNSEPAPNYSGILRGYPEDKIARVARYERVQFSSAMNHRKSPMTLKHFVIKVELIGNLADGRYVELASTETPPMVVRGRSPSNYQLNRIKRAKGARKQEQEDVEAVGGKAPELSRKTKPVRPARFILPAVTDKNACEDNSSIEEARKIDALKKKMRKFEGDTKTDAANNQSDGDGGDEATLEFDTTFLLAEIFGNVDQCISRLLKRDEENSRRSAIASGSGNTTTTAVSLKQSTTEKTEESDGQCNIVFDIRRQHKVLCNYDRPIMVNLPTTAKDDECHLDDKMFLDYISRSR